jgi:hypothetical protein
MNKYDLYILACYVSVFGFIFYHLALSFIAHKNTLIRIKHAIIKL